jgi:hypothetical protein
MRCLRARGADSVLANCGSGELRLEMDTPALRLLRAAAHARAALALVASSYGVVLAGAPFVANADTVFRYPALSPHARARKISFYDFGCARRAGSGTRSRRALPGGRCRRWPLSLSRARGGMELTRSGRALMRRPGGASDGVGFAGAPFSRMWTLLFVTILACLRARGADSVLANCGSGAVPGDGYAAAAALARSGTRSRRAHPGSLELRGRLRPEPLFLRMRTLLADSDAFRPGIPS